MTWFQKEIKLPSFSRGFHPVTEHVLEALPELSQVKVGLLHVHILHTSASLTINENADPNVSLDMEMAFNKIAPENWPYVHTEEGADDMPAHVKASLLGSALTVPIREGRLVLGTWQGIFLCEHRNQGGSRRLVLTVQGEPWK